MLEFLCDVALHPVLDGAVLENEKNVVMQEIDRGDDDRFRRLWNEANKYMFPGHPLGKRVTGSKESVRGATIGKLRAFHKKFFTPDRMAIVAVGAVDHEAMVKIAKRWFGTLHPGSVKESIKAPRMHAGEEFVQIDAQQSYIGIGFVSPRPTEKEEFALDFVAEFLGSGATGLLFREIREKRGLVYSIGASNTIFFDANSFTIGTSTTHPGEVAELILKAIDDFDALFTKQVFEEYREQLVNYAMRRLSKMGSIGGILSVQWLYGERMRDPFDDLKKAKAVKYEEVLAAKEKFLDRRRMFIMQLGKERAPIHIK